MSHVAIKPAFGVYDQVRHKSDRTATKDGLRLERSNLERRGNVLSAADLRLCFRIGSHDAGSI